MTKPIALDRIFDERNFRRRDLPMRLGLEIGGDDKQRRLVGEMLSYAVNGITLNSIIRRIEKCTGCAMNMWVARLPTSSYVGAMESGRHMGMLHFNLEARPSCERLPLETDFFSCYEDLVVWNDLCHFFFQHNCEPKVILRRNPHSYGRFDALLSALPTA